MLLERQQTWYAGFLDREDRVNDLAFKEQEKPKMPINLTEAVLDEAACRQIMTDLNFSKDGDSRRYPGKTLIESDYQKIYQRALALSENKKSVRCLFLLLLTDAFLRDENIQKMDAGALLKNYIDHSAKILRDQHGKKITDTGFLILAYATAFDGLTWNELTKSDNHVCMKKHWDDIKSAFSSGKERRSFLRQLSEAECEQDIVPPLKPDLIGEYLFLNKWNDCADEQDTWFAELLTNEYALHFLSLCLIDWPIESESLCDILSNQSADAKQRIACAEVFNLAVREMQSEEKQKEYAAKIKALDHDHSAAVLKEYTDVIRFIFEHAAKDTRAECAALLDDVNWTQYSPDTKEEQQHLADAYSDAASVFDDKGDYDKALEYYDKALAIREKVLGTEHPDTATTYNNIAGVYQDKGDYDKALEYNKKALAIREKVLGTEHPSTATTYNNIAGVYQAKGDYDKALEYFKKVLPVFEKVLGPEHPYTAATYNNIALVYKAKGDYDKALEYYNKALVIVEKVLGPEHPSTATTYNNIALVYKAKGDYDKALEYYNKALVIVEKVLGPEHPYTATTYHNIAGVYQAMGDYDKALEYSKKDLAISEAVLGPNHPNTRITYSTIAGIYSAMGNEKKALEYFLKSRGIPG